MTYVLAGTTAGGRDPARGRRAGRCAGDPRRGDARPAERALLTSARASTRSPTRLSARRGPSPTTSACPAPRRPPSSWPPPRARSAAGERDAARNDLARAHRLRPGLTVATPFFAVQARVELARAHLALGDGAGARTVTREAAEILRVRPRLGILGAQLADQQRQLQSISGTEAGGPRRSPPRSCGSCPADHPPLVQGDRRAALGLAQHDQDPGHLGLSQARGLDRGEAIEPRPHSG